MTDRIDPEFGHWFAGFVAGEGSFNITPNRGAWQCTFTIALRDDDIAILYEIQSELGIGQVYQRKKQGKSNPQVEWKVGSLDECLRLIHVLDRFSLRARKAKDYHIWRRAVFAKSAKDTEALVILADELLAARAYKSSPSAL